MKGFKISKASWLILSAGVFIVVLAGLGLTRSQQLKEQTTQDAALKQSEKSLGTIQTTQQSLRLEELKGKVDENQSLLNDAKARLNQTVISVDVTDEFFKIAENCSVNITNLNTSVIAQTSYEGIKFSTISLSASVTGEKKNIVNFIFSLNNGYVTGNVESAQITFDQSTSVSDTPESGGESGQDSTQDFGGGTTLESGLAKATVSMLIYSYEGK